MLASALRRSAAQPSSLQTLIAPKRAPAPAFMNIAKNRVLENQRKFQAQSDIPVYLRGRGKTYFRASAPPPLRRPLDVLVRLAGCWWMGTGAARPPTSIR